MALLSLVIILEKISLVKQFVENMVEEKNEGKKKSPKNH
jgi:hypothetical protein